MRASDRAVEEGGQEKTSEAQPIIELRNVSRIYSRSAGIRMEAVRNASLKIYSGEFVAITGHSGSGKTTLLNIIGCLDRATTGNQLFRGQNIGQLDEDEIARLRRDMFGFVFQNYNLIATATAAENVEIPGLYAGTRRSKRKRGASELLRRFGVGECANRRPAELSGGQQQRVAIARALMNDATVVLADEPTGALDTLTGSEVIGHLKRLADGGRTIVLVTHDTQLAAMASRRIELKDGVIVSDDGPNAPQVSQHPHESLPTQDLTNLLRYGLELLRTAGVSLRTNRLRTFLTLLGIVIGVASVVALTSIGESSRRQVMERIYGTGADLLTVRPDINAEGERPQLTDEDAQSIVEAVPNVISVLPEITTHLRVQRGSRNLLSTVIATGAAMPEVRNWGVSIGSFFSDESSDTFEAVTVIGSEVSDRLFDSREPLGQYIHVGTELFLVIGVMESKGGIWAAEHDNSVIVPLGSASARLVGRWEFDSLTVRVVKPEFAEQTAEALRSLLERWHGKGSLSVTANGALLDASTEILGTFSVLLGSIGSISLLVGGIGIMNMLLTSVAERTREIGIRMAVGARQSDILAQFLAEAVMISLAGALGGLVVGAVVGNLVIYVSNGTMLIAITPIVLALTSAVLIGFVFGYAPARRAAHMDPVNALAFD